MATGRAPGGAGGESGSAAGGAGDIEVPDKSEAATRKSEEGEDAHGEVGEGEEARVPQVR